MKHRTLLASTGLLTSLVMTGCKVGPNYKVPTMPAPPAYSDNGQNGAWPAAAPADHAERGAWWTVYNDEELNKLEEQCGKANQQIAAGLHAYEQAHDLVRVAHASLYPTLSIGASGTRSQLAYNEPLRPTAYPLHYWDFLVPASISWEPDFWGAVRRRIESASASAQQSAADLATTRLSLQGDLAITFFQVRGIDLQAQLLRSTLDNYTEGLKLTQARQKGGLASDSDVEEAKAQLEQTRAQLIDLGVQRAQYEHAIAVLIGAPATGFHLPEKPLAGTPPSVPTGIPSELLQRRPDIASAERQVAANNALIGVAKSAYYPSITLGATGELNSAHISDLLNQSSTAWAAGPSFNETIFDAGRRKAQVDYAIAQREQAVALYRQQVLSAFRDVEDQLAALRVLEDEAGVTTRAVDAAKRSTALATLRYKRGLTQYLEVLTDQTIQLTNERSAAALVSRRIVASVQLQMALGGNWSATQLPKN
ncbi:MAG: efflux transporter outer membrane subunit [Acidobacteriaceae bacterium]|nr:efflux transporter outer membrane subunit [Acidobacteriaceae bacterium]